MEPGLNELLKWGVTNSSGSTSSNPSVPAEPSRNINPDALAALFGGPSDADLMKESMHAILSNDPEISVDDKVIAFDNFEQLIENLDNANNLTPLGLWTPLLSTLSHPEAEIRKMGAWCIGTAVQNNEKTQEKCFEFGGIQKLVVVACRETEKKEVRRKAIYALSSACRNHQAAMDILAQELEKMDRIVGKVDAADMDAVDKVIGGLREEAANGL